METAGIQQFTRVARVKLPLVSVIKFSRSKLLFLFAHVIGFREYEAKRRRVAAPVGESCQDTDEVRLTFGGIISKY